LIIAVIVSRCFSLRILFLFSTTSSFCRFI
jgi:hypothetical protein